MKDENNVYFPRPDIRVKQGFNRITIPQKLYKSLAKIAYERGFDAEYFITQLLEHDLEVWQKQLSFLKEGENNEKK